MHEAHQFLQTLALVLCTAAVTTVVFQKLHQPVVLGYLLAGMVVGPHLPGPEADDRTVQTLAELGVILLMFSLGIEFSLSKLMRVGPTAGFVAVLQCSLMVWLGYLVGQAFVWTQLQSFYAGAVIAISSTTIIIKAFEEQRIKDDFTHIVFGILIVEDLIAILLITILTALSSGEELTAMEVAQATGRLAAFLISILVIGLLIVPRLMRAVVRLERSETTVVRAWDSRSDLPCWPTRLNTRWPWALLSRAVLSLSRESRRQSSIWSNPCAISSPQSSSCRSAC